MRDDGNDGTVDSIDDTDDNNGFWGYISDVSSTLVWADEHFVEFDISSSGLADEVYFDFVMKTGSYRVDYGPAKNYKVATFAGNGSVDTANLGSGDWLGDFTVPVAGDVSFHVDVTDVYNSFIGSGHDYLGFRFYDPVYTSDPSVGHQAHYIEGELSVNVVPLPGAALLGILGFGLTAAGTRLRRRGN